MKRLLLVAPRFDSEFYAGLRKTGFISGSIMAPLHLTTIAALTPDHWEVDIWDEGARDEITESTNFAKDYDLVATTAYVTHLPRAIDIGRIFRKRGVPVAIGGPGVSSLPQKCRPEFDVIFLGEGELIWRRFLKDFEQGHYLSEYRQVDRPDLMELPVPRWDLVKDDLTRYQLVGVQTTRGCPFDCEFCDVIHLYGRKPRHKKIDTVLAEVSLLHKMGGRRLFFCDDDFIGDWKYAQDLLKELEPVNRSFDEPMTVTTQCTIDLAKQDNILKLMADCNFTAVFIGVESPRKESLKEVKKFQNVRSDLVEDLHKIQSYGILVQAGLIVGFDHDDKTIFQDHIDFVQRARLTAVNVTTLKGLAGTPGYLRYQREGRMIDASEIARESPKVVTNILPKLMTLPELMEGYAWELERMRDWKTFRRRVMEVVRNVKYIPAIRTKAKFRLPRQRRVGGVSKPNFMKQLPLEGRLTVLFLYLYARFRAPHMMHQVTSAMGQHIVQWLSLPFQLNVIRKQIDMYKAGKFKLEVDESVGMIPMDFEKTVAKVMPAIYDRLAGEMDYKAGVQEAFVAVMKDFLIRWGKGFQGFEDFHMVYIQELCDRHVERWNQKFAEREGQFASNVLSLSREQSAHFKFIREMLTAVEQELRGEVRAQQEAKSLVQLAAKTA
ncbi:MAG: hypothetical protein C5B51_01190 [Terriglobia bacterium]|nr:MAG: hypothetical protein C5B51_01190 [Terriglobia bacterium]